MDFATEEKLCRLAHEIWRQIASEPCGGDPDPAPVHREASAEALHCGDGSAADPQCW